MRYRLMRFPQIELPPRAGDGLNERSTDGFVPPFPKSDKGSGRHLIMSLPYSNAINMTKDRGFARRVRMTKSLIADQESWISRDKYVYAGHDC